MTAVPLTPYLQFLDFNGIERSFGKVYTYAAGTTTQKATFTTAAGTVQAQNPVILNASGIPDHGSGDIGMIWIQGSYDFVVTNADGTDSVTIPNYTSFNTISAAGASYYQSFSGDGTTTTFTLSQPLGTDENAVLFFVDNGLQAYIKNGDFATDTIWTKGTGWTIGSGIATATGAISAAITQTASPTILAGQSYTITYTIATVTAGSLTASIGGTAGTARTTAGTYSETLIAGSTQIIALTGAGFSGTIDNVSVTPIEGIGRQVVPPTQFTLNNTTITFATAPAAGTNNIIGFAFSTLVAAASASAAAADASATAANTAATLAQNYAAALTSTSTTSLLVGLGSKTFITQAAKQYTAGQFVSAVSAANNANYMHGNVVSYTGNTLVLNITDIGGSGTLADWNLSISGTRGATAGASTPITANSILANNSASSAVPAALTIANNQLYGRGSTGNLSVITLGTGISMTGTILNVASSAWTQGTSTATGVSVDITSIPSTVTEIEIYPVSVQTNGSGSPYIQLGDSGGLENSGYLGTAWNSGGGVINHSTGFTIANGFANNTPCSGVIRISRANSSLNIWNSTGYVGFDSANATQNSFTGSKTLSATLDRFSIITPDTWTAGTFYYRYR